MTTTLKDRILAMKRANPRLQPAQIAKEIGCGRHYACRVLSSSRVSSETPTHHRRTITNPPSPIPRRSAPAASRSPDT